MTEDARRQIGLLVLADLAPADETQRASRRDYEGHDHGDGFVWHARWMAAQARYFAEQARTFRPFIVIIREVGDDPSPNGIVYPEQRTTWIEVRPTTLCFYFVSDLSFLLSLQKRAFEAWSANYLAGLAEQNDLLAVAGARWTLAALVVSRSILDAATRRVSEQVREVIRWATAGPLSLNRVLSSGGQTSLHAPLN